MKCPNCAFCEGGVKLTLGVFYGCKLKGVIPKEDCPYFKKQTDVLQEKK